MTRTIALSFTFSFVIVAAWGAQIVCYHEPATRLDPLAPVTFSVASAGVER